MLLKKTKQVCVNSMFFIILGTLWGCGVKDNEKKEVEIKNSKLETFESHESEIVVWKFSPNDPEHKLGGSGVDKRGSNYKWGGCSQRYSTWYENTIPVLILNNCHTPVVYGPYISFPSSAQSRGHGEVEADFVFNMAPQPMHERTMNCRDVGDTLKDVTKYKVPSRFNYEICEHYYDYDVPNHALFNIDVATNAGQTILASVPVFFISESELDNLRKTKAKFFKKSLRIGPFEIPQNLKNLEFRIGYLREFRNNSLHTVGLAEVRFKWFKAP